MSEFTPRVIFMAASVLVQTFIHSCFQNLVLLTPFCPASLTLPRCFPHRKNLKINFRFRFQQMMVTRIFTRAAVFTNLLWSQASSSCAACPPAFGKKALSARALCSLPCLLQLLNNPSLVVFGQMCIQLTHIGVSLLPKLNLASSCSLFVAFFLPEHNSCHGKYCISWSS